jgi:cytochrome P450
MCDWQADPLGYLDSAHARYGDVFSVQLPGSAELVTVLADLGDARRLYASPAHSPSRSRLAALRPILGERSLFFLDGAPHRVRRRLMLGLLAGPGLRRLEPAIRTATIREVARWPLGSEFALLPRMQSLALDVVLHAVLGMDEERADRLHELVGAALAGPGWEAIRADVDAVLEAEVAVRRAGTDVIGALVAAGLGETEIGDHVRTLLVAGSETTAATLAWAFDFVLHDETVFARALTEHDYLDAVAAETLRLRPVILLNGRRLGTPMAVAGRTLPAGANVSPSSWLAHTDPERYPDPHAFKPERFLHGASRSGIAFGGGAHRCVGAELAVLEMRIVLEEVLQRCVLRAAYPAVEHGVRRGVTLVPRFGTRVVLDTRR